jgi:glycosyltransferase involved in cell wall biosynthesis
MLSRAVKHVDAFLGLTKFAQTIHQREGLSVPFVHLPYFLPRQEADAAGEGLRSKSTDPAYFLYVGRLEKLKGVQTLIPVFRRYSRAQLWIAGSGNYEPRLRRMAKGSANIRFLGYLLYAKLHSLYANAVASIVPSLSYETSPLVIIEAASHKTPVIARNLGGTCELVTELGGGIIYDTESEMVAAMDRLRCDPALRDALGARSHSACQEKWSADAHVGRYLGLILDIATKRGIVF